MRKALLYIGILVFSAISCSKWSGAEKEQITVPEGKYLFTLRATTEYYTKTYYSDETTFKWSDDDEISVLFHNTAAGHETENKFYTLKTTTGGSGSADFSGLIDEGWEIGASDTGTKWALYPAGSHSYSAGDTYPTFNVPTVTDFTASHVSANLPMVTDGVGGYKFYHLTNAFKFTFTNIDVSKVKLVVENQSSKYLSGNIPIKDAGTREYYLSYEYGSSASKTITLIKDVSSKTAEFYVPFRIYDATFQPRLTLYDASNNYTIKTVTATSDFSAVSVDNSGSGGENRLFKNRRIIVIPSISASGMGNPFVSAYGIDWSSVTNAATGDTRDGKNAVSSIKATADGSYVYALLEIPNGNPLIYNIEGSPYSNRSYLYVGDGTGSKGSWSQGANNSIEVWLKTGNVATFHINTTGYIKDNAANVSMFNNVIYVELALDRSSGLMKSSNNETLYMKKDVSSTVYFGFTVTDKYYAPGASSSSGTGSNVGYAPASGVSMLAVTVPAYVAP